MNAVPEPARWDLLGLLSQHVLVRFLWNQVGDLEEFCEWSICSVLVILRGIFWRRSYESTRAWRSSCNFVSPPCVTSVTPAHLWRWSCWVGCFGLLLSFRWAVVLAETWPQMSWAMRLWRKKWRVWLRFILQITDYIGLPSPGCASPWMAIGTLGRYFFTAELFYAFDLNWADSERTLRRLRWNRPCFTLPLFLTKTSGG